MLASLNWVDWIIVAVVFYYIIEGWQTGLIYLLSNLASFIGALWLAIKYRSIVGNFLVTKLGLSSAWTNVAGLILIALVGEIILSEIFDYVVGRLPKKFQSSKINSWLGAIVSAINGLVLIAFFLLLILALPLRGNIKQDIKDSKIGSYLVMIAEKYGGSVTSSLNQMSADAIKFLTVEPGSNERISLDVAPDPSSLSLDPASEQIMVNLVNSERAKAGVGSLRVDQAMTTVARAHSLDMFVRRYFSHLDPDGHDAAWRMEQAAIPFTVVGENLAFAPDVNTAHAGLMNSPGHRQNIMDSEFHRVGVGIVNGGIYGEMFTQMFAD